MFPPRNDRVQKMIQLALSVIQETVGLALVVAVQMNGLAALPMPWNGLDIMTPLVVYFAATGQRLRALRWALVAGLLADLLAANGFGVRAASLLGAVGVVTLSAEQLVTNRTWLSFLALGIIGSVTGVAANIFFLWQYEVFQLTVWPKSLPWNTLTVTGLAYNVFGQCVLLAGLLYWYRGRTSRGEGTESARFAGTARH